MKFTGKNAPPVTPSRCLPISVTATSGLPADSAVFDYGRMRITRNPADSLKFKVPSLRNVMVTFPYGHNGRFFSILDVMNHYRGEVVEGPTTDPLVKGIETVEF